LNDVNLFSTAAATFFHQRSNAVAILWGTESLLGKSLKREVRIDVRDR
jgi:hypothetical protein